MPLRHYLICVLRAVRVLLPILAWFQAAPSLAGTPLPGGGGVAPIRGRVYAGRFASRQHLKLWLNERPHDRIERVKAPSPSRCRRPLVRRIRVLLTELTAHSFSFEYSSLAHCVIRHVPLLMFRTAPR